MTNKTFIEAYCARLHLSSTQLTTTRENLGLLMERHLQYIPFENLSMHTTSDDPIVLTRQQLINKVLLQNRGGCCLELNGLFCYFLQALGYQVRLVPCWVNAGRERGHASTKPKFRVRQSHFFLLVSVDASILYMVDVGLGEPACHPLAYGTQHLNAIQRTPEGMKSRIRWDKTWRDGERCWRTCLLLEWQKHKQWEPRLQWDVADAPLTTPQDPITDINLGAFRPVVSILLHPKSSFSRRLIVCKLTRTKKVSLIGRVLRMTSPRCGGSVQQTVLESDKEVYEILSREFGIQKKDDIDFAASDESANTQLWQHL